MISLEWSVFTDTAVDSFNVYRSIPGWILPFPNGLADGDRLIFSATSPDIQNILIPSSDIDTFVNTINTKARGLVATKSQDETKVYIRATAKKNAKLKTYNCSALKSMGIAPAIYAVGVEWELVDNVLYDQGTVDYLLNDPDGSIYDLYKATSVTGSQESVPSIIVPVIPDNPNLCVLEARFVDPVGKPVQNVMVRATLYVPEQGGIAVSPVVQNSDAYGRVSMPLLQNRQYLIEIPAIGYNWVVDIPEQGSANILSLPATLKHLFSPFGDPI